ncbi:MAG: rhomboid family intramembrane serine protease, partial [Deltaproteobacteria bacterium]|nr:rhomboid family intramembrane serine protease [Deltaproteobacteria bacterium]
MFPVRDSIAPRRAPVLVPVLIALNVLVYLYMLPMPAPRGEAWITMHGLVPARFLAELGDPRALVPALTSMFLHGGLLHLAGNMWFLWIFGDNVEDRLGRLGFVAFYLCSGIAAALGQILAEPGSTLPMV